MKLNIPLIVLALLSSLSSMAQDQIFLKSGDVMEGRIEQIDSKEIKYTKADNIDGPLFSLRKNLVYMIIYENGETQVLNFKGGDYENSSKNAFMFNYGDLIESRVAISYRRLFSDGKIGLKLPLAVNVNSDSRRYGIVFQSGLDFNFYPLGQKRVTYYAGLGTRMGLRNGGSNYYFDELGNYIQEDVNDLFFVGIYVNNGLVLHLTDNYAIGGLFGLGLRDNGLGYGFQTNAIGELNLIFKF